MKIKIYYEDTDAGGVVYHSNYLNFFERARSELFFQQGIIFGEANEHFVARHINISFKHPAKLGDEIEIQTVLKELKKASCTLLQMAYKDDVLLACADVNLCFTRALKPAKIPERYLKVINDLRLT